MQDHDELKIVMLDVIDSHSVDKYIHKNTVVIHGTETHTI